MFCLHYFLKLNCTAKNCCVCRNKPPSTLADRPGWNLAVVHCGAPCCGMNAAVRSFTRYVLHWYSYINKSFEEQWKCNFHVFLGNYDRLTDQQRTDEHEGSWKVSLQIINILPGIVSSRATTQSVSTTGSMGWSAARWSPLAGLTSQALSQR